MHSARSQSRARYEADGGNLIEQKFIISCNQVMTCTNGPHLGRDAKLAEKEARRRKSKKSIFFLPDDDAHSLLGEKRPCTSSSRQ